MSRVDCMPEGQIEGLARVLGECGSRSNITRVLKDRGLTDNSGESTKWRRLYLNRPGFPRGSMFLEDGVHGKTEELLTRGPGASGAHAPVRQTGPRASRAG